MRIDLCHHYLLRCFNDGHELNRILFLGKKIQNQKKGHTSISPVRWKSIWFAVCVIGNRWSYHIDKIRQSNTACLQSLSIYGEIVNKLSRLFFFSLLIAMIYVQCVTYQSNDNNSGERWPDKSQPIIFPVHSTVFKYWDSKCAKSV